jgi:hypothetical protein
LCLQCYREKQRKEALARAARQEAEKEERRKRKIERIMKRFPSPVVEICPESPSQRHHWYLDSNNHGVCRYCRAEKDFAAQIPERRFADYC